jgi:hypothetical protein
VQGEETWENIVEATGWSIDDCLSFKLSFKKREDAKLKSEAMGLHLRRLRALGWHLRLSSDRLAMDNKALQSCVEKEVAENEAQEKVAEQLREQVAWLQVRVVALLRPQPSRGAHPSDTRSYE